MPEPAIRHGGGIGEAARRYGGDPSGWLDLSTGINPVPASLPDIPAAAWHRLPEQYQVDAAREAAAVFYRTAGARPLPVPGIQAVIQRLPLLVQAGARAAVLAPTYGEYGLVLRQAGIGTDEVRALAEVGPEHGLVIIVNPNNPDGRKTPRSELLSLARELGGRGGHLVVDEAFADADPGESVAGDAGRCEGLIVLRSFGKFFGLAGMRLGFVLGPGEILERLERAFGPWPVSGPALAVSRALMGDVEVLAGLRSSIAERHAAMREVLGRADLVIRGETSLFFLVDHARARDLHDSLCRRHVLVRTFDYAPNWLRIGLAPDAAAEARFLRALAAEPC